MSGKRSFSPQSQRGFIPALGRDLLTPLYDLAIRLTLPERRFKSRLIESARLAAGMRVLDIGCGTGTLLVLAAAAAPEAVLFGVDIDDRILAFARGKLDAARLHVELQRASATELPHADQSFDRVLSTLAFHHLTRDEKARAFAEAYRTLRLGGELHLGDFGAPDTPFLRVTSFITEKIGHEHVQENYRGLLPVMARDAGFVAVEETGRFPTMFGVLRSFRASRPANDIHGVNPPQPAARNGGRALRDLAALHPVSHDATPRLSWAFRPTPSSITTTFSRRL